MHLRTELIIDQDIIIIVSLRRAVSGNAALEYVAAKQTSRVSVNKQWPPLTLKINALNPSWSPQPQVA